MLRLIATLCLAQTPPTGPTLAFADGRFTIIQPGSTESVSIEPPVEAPAKAVRYRKDKAFAVWDHRGLSVRNGNWVQTTRLQEIALTPKFFSSEQIKENAALAKAGKRGIKATAISGTMRLGNFCYFVMRYEDKGGTPWLEALVSIDLTAEKPKPKLLGRFQGLSPANGMVDERLLLVDKQLGLVTQDREKWGIGLYDPATDAFGYKEGGLNLKTHAMMKDDRILFVEETNYGQAVMGVWDWRSEKRLPLFENQGFLRLLDGEQPLVGVVGGKKFILRNLVTGSQLELPAGATARRVSGGVLAWWPREKPTEAGVYRAGRWEKVVGWKAAKP